MKETTKIPCASCGKIITATTLRKWYCEKCKRKRNNEVGKNMKIEEIIDGGTLVSLIIRGDGKKFIIQMDRRMFEHMNESEKGNLIGRKIKLHETNNDEKRIEFLD